jgi:hypothetical protein
VGSHSSEDSAPDPQEVQWLTPAPDGTPVHLPWPAPDGPFLLTCDLAQVDGRTMLVGLDMRCLSLDADGGPTPGPRGLLEVNHPALRSLRAGEIAEAARARLAATLAARSGTGSWDDLVGATAHRTFEALTSPNRSRPTGARPASPQLQRVAQLYLRAVAAGGDAARRPSNHVYNALREEGSDVSLNTVRGQIHRARVKGLIPPGRG